MTNGTTAHANTVILSLPTTAGPKINPVAPAKKRAKPIPGSARDDDKRQKPNPPLASTA